jgi:pSer/pThr/pTyr-binding forkhead associated (FHA) protein
MYRLQIPYDNVLLDPTDFDLEEFDKLLGHFFDLSAKYPLVIEIYNQYTQYLAFVREGQLYWVAVCDEEGFKGITVRKFFASLRKTQFPKIIVYQTSLVLYHSLLVYLQKKHDLKVNSSLVDLDELLDGIEQERHSSLVTAYQPGNLIMLRYQDGKAISCYGGNRGVHTIEANAREDFLVRVYTLSARNPFEIKLFADLTVTHADDARPLPEGYKGSILSFYISRPPKLTVRLKNRPLKTYAMTGNELTIGRLPQNDIVIDNLSVSRRHTVITKTKEGYLLRDCNSKNGTFLNGNPVKEALLVSEDVITIGKYQIVFQEQSGETENVNSVNSMDQTVIIPNFHTGEKTDPFTVRHPHSPPRIYRRSDHEEHVLDKDETLIGKSRDAEIRLKGLFAPRISLKITRSGDDYVIQQVAGKHKLSINGEEMEEKVLEEEDLISVGSEEFVFKR